MLSEPICQIIKTNFRSLDKRLEKVEITIVQIIDKKILIISHNPLSCVNNNGKTLASIFEGVSKDNIYQIYLSTEIPDYCDKSHFLQINEKQILSSFIYRKNLCCCPIKADPNQISSTAIKKRNFANHTKRLLREVIWKFSIWKPKLREWLKDEQFDVVFFMAGDGLFAYDIYNFVMQHVNSKGCVFFTDDYIIGKTSFSPIAFLRQFLLKRKIKNTLYITKDLYVISEEMKEAYKKLFKVEGYVIRNFSVERVAQSLDKMNSSTDNLVMLYAGGLHYNRWKVLSKIANALKCINESNPIKCQLKIYSSQNISDKIINQITVEGASEFCGSAAASQIAILYGSSNILLHVESFDRKAIASTKYSFSTKIPEYLSAGKCVLAVGPLEVASIQYLSKCASVISDDNSLVGRLTDLVNNAEYREMIKQTCEKTYIEDFSHQKQEESLKQIMFS